MLLRATKMHIMIAAVMCIADCRMLESPRGEREVSGEAGEESSEQTRPAQLLKNVCAQTRTAYINDALPNQFQILERYKLFAEVFPQRILYDKPVTSKSHQLCTSSVFYSHVYCSSCNINVCRHEPNVLSAIHRENAPKNCVQRVSGDLSYRPQWPVLSDLSLHRKSNIS